MTVHWQYPCSIYVLINAEWAFLNYNFDTRLVAVWCLPKRYRKNFLAFLDRAILKMAVMFQDDRVLFTRRKSRLFLWCNTNLEMENARFSSHHCCIECDLFFFQDVKTYSLLCLSKVFSPINLVLWLFIAKLSSSERSQSSAKIQVVPLTHLAVVLDSI